MRAMTARQPPRPDGLNAKGNGRGLKKVAKPVPKKRGKEADRSVAIADNRARFVSASNIPTAQIADTVDPNKPLTEKAKLFVKYWAQGDTIPAASAKAGYGDGATYAYKVARFPQAVALYNEEKRLYEEAAQMTRKQVMDGLLEGIEMAKLMADPGNVITGWKTIGQMCGYFEPVKKRIELNVTGQVMFQKMEQMSDAELAAVLMAKAPELLAEGDGSDDPEEI
jgi:hypothetical protein